MAEAAVEVATMKVAQVPAPGQDFQIVERDLPKAGAGEVRIKVQACGVCHSDALTKEGSWPGIQYPRIPGHEVVGLVDEAGAGVSASVGMGDTTTRAANAGAATSEIATIAEFRASATTEDIRST